MPEIRSFEHRIANNREGKEKNRILNYVLCPHKKDNDIIIENS
jgi:hypothetical protein